MDILIFGCLETYTAGIQPRYQFENCYSSGSGKFTIADEDDYSDMPDHQGFRSGGKVILSER